MFTIAIGIYDSTLNFVETKNYNGGVYPITITLGAVSSGTPAGTLHNSNSDSALASSVINGFTTAGLYNSSNLQVVSKGNFCLVVSSSAEPTIISGKVFLEIE